jgi:hypothetical protein
MLAKRDGNRPLGKTRRKWGDNIKMDIRGNWLESSGSG